MALRRIVAQLRCTVISALTAAARRSNRLQTCGCQRQRRSKTNDGTAASRSCAYAEKPEPEVDGVIGPYEEDHGSIASVIRKPQSAEPRVRLTVEMSERMHERLVED